MSSAYTPVALQTGNASQIVSGVFDPARLPAATSSTQGAVPSYQYEELDISSNGDFSAAQPVLRIVKIGALVTLTWPSVAHTSDSTPASASGFIPAAYRPAYNLYNTYLSQGATVHRVNILSNGTLSFEYLNWSGTLTAQTTTVAGSVSWVVDA